MYLPTFWKLVNENRKHYIRHAVGWGVPASFFGKFFAFNSELHFFVHFSLLDRLSQFL